MNQKEVNIAIIGAGITGLFLAEKLINQYGIESVLVIEANNRIGGRILNQPTKYDNVIVEGGAQFIGGSHIRMLTLLEKLELEKFPAEVKGKFRWAQEIGWFQIGLSPNIEESSKFHKLREKVQLLAKKVPIDEPWSIPEAKELDSISFGQWLNQNSTSKSARIPYERLCQLHVGCNPNEVSLLYMLFLLQSTGGYYRFIEHENGAHQYRVRGGTGLICSILASKIGIENILLNAPVVKIKQDNNRAIITGESFQVTANQVVITVQPQLCQNIDFKPALDESHIALQKGMLTQKPYAAKVHLIYSNPFWREKGYSGTGVASSGVVFVDNSPPDGDVGILLVFRDTRRKDLSIKKILRYAGTLFGAEAKKPEQIVEQDWSKEQWSASCISHMPPGILSQYGQSLRKKTGLIHWAGAETSHVWPSFMEGGLESAERVAKEIVSQ